MSRLLVHSCTYRNGRWEVRIRLPDFEEGETAKDISVGSWNSPEAHGLLVSTPDPTDLRAIALLLAAAADYAEARKDGK